MVLARRPGAALALPPAVQGLPLAALAILLLAAKQGGFFPPAWRYGVIALAAVVVLQRLWARAGPSDGLDDRAPGSPRAPSSRGRSSRPPGRLILPPRCSTPSGRCST